MTYNHSIFWTKNRINWLTKHYSSMKITDCAKHLGCPWFGVGKKARELDLRGWYKTRYEPDKVFTRLTDLSRDESCYLLGLIWADGNIRKGSGREKGTYTGVRIALVIQDMNELDHLFHDLGNMYEYEGIPKRGKPFKTYECRSPKLADWLIQYDFHIKSQVTPSKLWDEMSETGRQHFLRGWIDGDGCWMTGKKNKVTRWQLSGTYKQNWGVIEHLFKTLKIEYRINRRIVKGGRVSDIFVTRATDVAKIGDYIYAGWNNRPIGLPRKYILYEKVLKRAAEIIQRDREISTLRASHMAFIRSNPHLSREETSKALNITIIRVQNLRAKIRRNSATSSET